MQVFQSVGDNRCFVQKQCISKFLSVYTISVVCCIHTGQPNSTSLKFIHVDTLVNTWVGVGVLAPLFSGSEIWRICTSLQPPCSRSASATAFTKMWSSCVTFDTAVTQTLRWQCVGLTHTSSLSPFKEHSTGVAVAAAAPGWRRTETPALTEATSVTLL